MNGDSQNESRRFLLPDRMPDYVLAPAQNIPALLALGGCLVMGSLAIIGWMLYELRGASDKPIE